MSPAARLTEEQFQAQVVELAHVRGWEHMHARRSIGRGRKWVTATNVPWPDLTLWHPRRGLILRELKVGKLAGGGVANDQWQDGQREVLESLRGAGVDVDVWTPEDWPRIELELGRCRSYVRVSAR